MGEVEELLTAIKAGERGRVEKILLLNPALVDARGADGGTPLLLAIYYGAREITSILLTHGASPDPFEAAALGDLRRLRQLLDEQPGLLQARSHDGWTPLHLAAHFGQVETIDWLLRRGAEIGAPSTNTLANTPLHAAAAGRRRRAVELLLVAGADPNAADADGHTALHSAAQAGDLDMTQMLLGFGARVDVRGGNGRTPLDLAAEGNHPAIVELLRGAPDGG